MTPESSPCFVPGGRFIYAAATAVAPLWGRADEVLWAEGEPLLLTGPPGVGKTTLCAQLVAGRMGLLPDLLDYRVRVGARVLYLACDRPLQIRRALYRLFRQWPEAALDDPLVFLPGPPPHDLARRPDYLLELANEARADTVVIDSLKDVAARLSDEDTGHGLNRAMQLCVGEGVEVLAVHHQVKKAVGDRPPNRLADVYGSAWLTAGAGSVVLLWGSAGDRTVELTHLKQPAQLVGPLQLRHDHDLGRTFLDQAPVRTTATDRATSAYVDSEPLDQSGTARLRDQVVALLAEGPMGARDVADRLFSNTSDASIAKARRVLRALVQADMVRTADTVSRGGTQGGAHGARYALVGQDLAPAAGSMGLRVDSSSTNAGTVDEPTDASTSAEPTDASTSAEPTEVTTSDGASDRPTCRRHVKTDPQAAPEN